MIVCLDEAFRKSLLSWRKWLYCYPADAQDFEEEEKGYADAAAADDDINVNVYKDKVETCWKDILHFTFIYSKIALEMF